MLCLLAKASQKYKKNMDNNMLYLFAVLLVKHRRKKRSKNCSRNMWVREIFKNRQNLGEYSNLVRELELGDREFYFR